MEPADERRPTIGRGGLTRAQGWIFTAALAMPGMTLIALEYLRVYLPRGLYFGASWETREWVFRSFFLVVLAGSSAFNAWMIATTEAPEGRPRKTLMLWTTIGNMLLQGLLAFVIYGIYFSHFSIKLR